MDKQSVRPDESKIWMTFETATQYPGEGKQRFTVYFLIARHKTLKHCPSKRRGLALSNPRRKAMRCFSFLLCPQQWACARWFSRAEADVPTIPPWKNFKCDVDPKNSRIEQVFFVKEQQSRCSLRGVILAMSPIKKINFLFFLLTICVIAAGCSSAGPWPRVDVVESSLGVGEIADYLLKNRFNGAVIKRVGELLSEKITEKDICFIEKNTV